MIYRNRQQAGKELAKALIRYKGEAAVVLALPRGGIVLGAEVAKSLRVPLGLVLVRKIGHPSYAEYAVGAIAEDETPIYNQSEIANIDKTWLKHAETAARELIVRRREQYYGKDFVAPSLLNKTAIIVDDGIATGLTMQAAVKAVRNKHSKQVIVAVPVASQESVDALKDSVDQLIVLDNPENFLGAVGAHYQEFDQVNDEVVGRLLREVHDDMLQNTATHR